jgi:hypothetical protein
MRTILFSLLCITAAACSPKTEASPPSPPAEPTSTPDTPPTPVDQAPEDPAAEDCPEVLDCEPPAEDERCNDVEAFKAKCPDTVVGL